ncbi:Eco57I restriction-modification methylase domain-containing protein [Streptococcus mitis]|uniref:site-specific DNA-methyltransferase (adenine-specific) n=1 Tax=Streptococcus mitis TaxID=28037 RepID=A0A3R9IRT8_STRMT|nr:adenine methyltransferase [Streptococcus mitis]RSI86215.1 Eco57I restriction-modification methylase [Streptococcus mitis]
MQSLKELIENLKNDIQSFELVATYLGYSLGENPIENSGEWKILFTDKLEDKSRGVMAIKFQEDLNSSSKTIEVRRLYKQVEKLRDSYTVDFDTQLVGFIGENRIVIFPTHSGNRDVRLDINLETAEKSFYISNFNLLKNENIQIEEDDFGFGEDIRIPEGAFTQQLSSHFLVVVSYYRKKLSELITASPLKQELKELVGFKAQFYLEQRDLINLVEDDTYTAVLSNVVDTIILRQLMRRFLEGYYGSEAFNVNDIALGVGNGTLDDALKKIAEAEATIRIGDEDTFKKLNRKKTPIKNQNEISLFDIFDDDEQRETSSLSLEENSKEQISEISRKATEQFRTVYDGDLFAGSVGQVADRLEILLAEDYTDFWTKLWLDTSAQEYSFRYEDLPPNAIERQYENSMSQNVQIRIEDNNTPVVFYGEDIVEQKNKGAYYTDERFVNYMVKQTVEVEFEKRYSKLKDALKSGELSDIQASVEYLLDLKIADLSSGGGSFLRGAFQLLTRKQPLMSTLNLPQEIEEQFPYFREDDEAIYQWEKYILEHMIYGVDIDYKAIIISSLTLTLSSIEHRPKDMKLPSLIGRNLIHQNSLINTVPYLRRKEIYANYRPELKELRKLKVEGSEKYEIKRAELQSKLLKYLPEKLRAESTFLHIEAIEVNLPEIFFDENGEFIENSGFDVVIGNPPWEIWKPNSDEFFSQYDDTYLSLSRTKKTKRQGELFETMPRIKDKWEEELNRIEQGSIYFRHTDNFSNQSWIVEDRRTSSDINLYKISVERFLQLLKPEQYISLIVPDNLMTDLGSTGLRHLIFDEYDLEEFLSFENRLGIFQTIHRSYKFAVTTIKKSPSKREKFKAFFYKLNLDALNQENEKMGYPFSLVKEAEPEKYSLFEPRSIKEFNLYQKIKLKFPPLRETEVIKLRRDFDKTNDSALFLPIEEADYPLYEGKLMNQFKLVDVPTEGVSESDILRKTGADYEKYRIGIRAIASATNQRSLIATLFLKGSTAAHSMWMERDAGNSSIEEKLFYLGLINSYALDFVLKKLVNTNISQTYLKQLPIPTISDVSSSDEIIQIVKQLLLENGPLYEELKELVPGENFNEFTHDALIAELNARVMVAFDLTREDIIDLMKTFETANHKTFVEEETQRIIAVYDRINR